MLPQNQLSLPPHKFEPTILREYDIRGIVGQHLNTNDAYAIGLCFGTLIKRAGGRKIITGRDGRLTSSDLQQALIEGLRTAGCNVINIGVGPTPMTYFAAINLKADGAIMVTGSHNPAEYNGFKFVMSGKPFYGDAITAMGQMAQNADWDTTLSPGTLVAHDIRPAYINRLISDLKSHRPLNIAWDAGHGAAGEVLQQLVKHIPGEHHILYADIDGTFPAHHPDPTVDKNLADLRALVREKNCDLGIAFDGDGDRIGAVDEQANIIRCDMLLALYAAEIIAKNPGAPIIGDIKCSNVLFDEIARLGGTPIMWKTGHSLIKSKMAETKAPLAGELSGHIFIADGYYGYDDALYCAIRLLNIISDASTSLSAHLAHLPTRQSTPEIRIEVDDSQKFDIVKTLSEHLKQSFSADDYTLSNLDGIRIDGKQGWLLLRPSNTQNCLVTRIEADTAESLDFFKKQLENALSKVQLTLPE